MFKSFSALPTAKRAAKFLIQSAAVAGVILTSGTVSAPLLTGEAEAAQSYVLACRGGGAMQAVAGQRVSQRRAFVEIRFRPGRQGAGVRAPAPGECTWVDRGFRSGEPAKLIYRERGNTWIQSVCSSRGCSTSSNSRNILKLMNNVRSGRAFQLRVYNNRSGHMEVTRVGP